MLFFDSSKPMKIFAAQVSCQILNTCSSSTANAGTTTGQIFAVKKMLVCYLFMFVLSYSKYMLLLMDSPFLGTAY